jgi:hypothetical protein
MSDTPHPLRIRRSQPIGLGIQAGPPAEVPIRLTGPRGHSAYEVAVQNGFAGTQEQWLASIGGEGSGIVHETAIGAINGVNAVFFSSHPFDPDFIQVFDGILLTAGVDYSPAGPTSIQLNFSPYIGEKIILFYRKL